MTILLDASTPAFAHASNPSGAAVPTTASFSPPANSLLVALCGFDFGGTFTSMAVADSGSHTWTQRILKHTTSTPDVAAIYTCPLTSAPGSITVTMTPSGSITGCSSYLGLKVLTGATLAGSPATANGGSTGATVMTASITTTVIGSKVYFVVAVDDPETTATPASGMSTLDNWQDSTFASVYGGAQSSPTSSPGSETVGWTMSPTSSLWSLAALEIIPSSSPAPSGLLAASLF